MVSKCNHKFGCHGCTDTLMILHAAIRQYLVEPAVNHERLRKEMISVKDFIEDIVNGGGETEDGNLEPGDGISSSDESLEHREKTGI